MVIESPKNSKLLIMKNYSKSKLITYVVTAALTAFSLGRLSTTLNLETLLGKAPEKNSEEKVSKGVNERIAQTTGTPEDYLITKEGFTFKISNLEFREKFPSAPPLRLFHDAYGQEFSYEIRCENENVMETLEIDYHNKDILASARVVIKDGWHNSEPNIIYIFDSANNTNVQIQKDRKGKISFTGNLITQEIATDLYNEFSAVYASFRKYPELNKQIRNYTPKLEIRLSEPPSENRNINYLTNMQGLTNRINP